MLFQSFDFLVLFPLVAGIYFLLPARFRWVLILIASCGFYMFWNPWYILLLAASTLTDYFAGILIYNAKSLRGKKSWLTFSLLINLGLLGVFKYYNFFAEQFGWIIRLFDPGYSPYLLQVLLPVGISFYTFQTIGYTLDVYRGKTKPINHLGKFAVFVSFFPQLVAGPIERIGDLFPQLHFNYSFDTRRITGGLRLFLWGLFKKLVLADRIGTYVSLVFASPDEYKGGVVLMAGYLFFFQIYYDFSAYQDMAVGTARILGVNLSKNFEPLILLSSSFRKFWRGWHITLTNWIRDYIYVPLTLKEKNVAAINLGPVYIFFFVGLWHGANWTYIIWGTLQGVFIVAERLLQPVRIFLEKSVGKVVIDAIGFILFFNAFTFANFFFRSASVSQALHTMKNIFVYPGTGLNPGLIPLEFYLLFSLLALAVVFEFSRRKHPPIDLINFRRGWVRWSTYLILGLAVWFLRIPEDIKFIYFDF